MREPSKGKIKKGLWSGLDFNVGITLPQLDRKNIVTSYMNELKAAKPMADLYEKEPLLEFEQHLPEDKSKYFYVTSCMDSIDTKKDRGLLFAYIKKRKFFIQT